MIKGAINTMDQYIASADEVILYNQLIRYFPEIEERAMFKTANKIGICFTPSSKTTRWLSLDGIHKEYFARLESIIEESLYNDALEEYIK